VGSSIRVKESPINAQDQISVGVCWLRWWRPTPRLARACFDSHMPTTLNHAQDQTSFGVCVGFINAPHLARLPRASDNLHARMTSKASTHRTDSAALRTHTERTPPHCERTPNGLRRTANAHRTDLPISIMLRIKPASESVGFIDAPRR